MKNFFKQEGNAFEILFWGILITLIFTVNPEYGGMTTLYIGLTIVAILIICCFVSRGYFTLAPKRRGDGSLYWYTNSPEWTQKINGIEMTYDQYLNIFNDGFKSTLEYEKEMREYDGEINYYYDGFPDDIKNDFNQPNLYGKYLKIYEFPNKLYRDEHGTFRVIGDRTTGGEIGRKYVNGDVKMRRRGYLKPEYESNPLFFHPKVDEWAEKRRQNEEMWREFDKIFGNNKKRR